MSDIALLFEKDPDSLTTEDIDETIAYLRARRAEFSLGQKQAGNVKKLDLNKPVNKGPAIDLGELGL